MTQPMTLGWAGSSNTASAIGYRVLADDALLAGYPAYLFTFLNISVSGWATWPNLVNRADLSSANLIVFDQSNDDTTDQPDVEAFVRLASAASQRVIGIINPAWTATTDDQINIPANLTAMQQHKAVLDAYGMTYVDGYAMMQAHVTGGGHITDWFADTAHYNATGYAVIEAALDDYLPTGGAIPTPLPARVYAESADLEHAPIIRNGADNDGTTGTWTTNGTAILSSEIGATITYTGTFRHFGSYRTSGSYPTVTVTIDGGAPITNFAFYANGYDIGTRAAHTVVITVTSAVRIDEFWAI